jgi:two-component system sensor histidine kinase BaeS
MRLQRRVLVYLALVAIASCALTVAVGVVLVRRQVASQRLAALEAQAALVAVVGGPPQALQPGDHVYRVGTGRARPVARRTAAAVLAAIPGSDSSQGTVDIAGRAVLYAARPTPSGRIVLIRPARIAFAEWRPFIASLLLAGLGGTLLAVALSFVLARRLTRPIDELSAATRRVAAGDPEVAVPVRGADELAELGVAFNEMSGELAQARQAQARFLESVSHELRTPLTSIRGYAEGLEEQAVAPAEAARIIETEAGRLERLVADLLDLARLGRADFAVAREAVDLGDVVRHAVERHLPQARELSVELAGSATADAWGQADADRILQAVSNLIENSLRLTPAGGSVLVRAGPGEIVVRDTGPGLAADDIPRAFERFYLHGRYRSERPVGSGLGLAIVRELVGAMGGSVAAAVPEGGGAQFTIRLPPAPARSARPDAVRPYA